MTTFRSFGETYLEYENRFTAQLAKLNALGASVARPGSIAALMMLTNESADSAQRIYILEAAAPSDNGLLSLSLFKDFIVAVRYDTTACVLRKRGSPGKTVVHPVHRSANSAFTATDSEKSSRADVETAHAYAASATSRYTPRDRQTSHQTNACSDYRIARCDKIPKAKKKQGCRRCDQLAR